MPSDWLKCDSAYWFTEEGTDFCDQLLPGRLICQRQVVTTVQDDEAGVGNERRDLAAFAERNALVAGGMKNQRRRFHEGQTPEHIDAAADGLDASGSLTRR